MNQIRKNGILYTDAGIELDDVGKYTIKAVCKNDKGIYSDVVTCKYKTEAKAPDYPEVTPDGGTMDDITFVVITADEGCSIYYTWMEQILQIHLHVTQNQSKYRKVTISYLLLL